MKNNGFTLIELLIVIVIMGILGTVITITVTETTKKTNQELCDSYVTEIEESACLYASLNAHKNECMNGCTLSVRTLVESGLVNSTYDKCTGNDIESGNNASLNSTVTVSFNNGEKTCTYNGVKVYAR